MHSHFTFYVFLQLLQPVFLAKSNIKLRLLLETNSSVFQVCFTCLLMLHLVYCNDCVLNDVNGACYCTCPLLFLSVPEMCIWSAKSGKNLKFLRCIQVFDLVLRYCSDIYEGLELQILFYFIVLMKPVTLVAETLYFYPFFRL